MPNNPSKIFRVYNKLNATVFDLLSGDTETKQTIGLGYLFANDDITLEKFINKTALKKIIGKFRITNFNKIVIHTELTSKTGKRADIVIQFYKNNLPDFAVIIEAKNISLNISPYSVQTQIENYIKDEEFKYLEGFKIFGCILTKNDGIIDSEKICSISWNELITILVNGTKNAQDYLTFLTNINGTMNFYEKEVYSLPAGDSYQWQYEYPYIYECPNIGKNFTSMKKPLYFAFRKHKGIMERLFGVEKIIIMNPKQDFQLFIEDPNYSTDIKERIKFYCDQFWGEGKYDDNEKQFFILSKENQIELPHKPRPKINNSFRAYYTLSELLDSKKTFVNTIK